MDKNDSSIVNNNNKANTNNTNTKPSTNNSTSQQQFNEKGMNHIELAEFDNLNNKKKGDDMKNNDVMPNTTHLPKQQQQQNNRSSININNMNSNGINNNRTSNNSINNLINDITDINNNNQLNNNNNLNHEDIILLTDSKEEEKTLLNQIHSLDNILHHPSLSSSNINSNLTNNSNNNSHRVSFNVNNNDTINNSSNNTINSIINSNNNVAIVSRSDSLPLEEELRLLRDSDKNTSASSSKASNTSTNNTGITSSSITTIEQTTSTSNNNGSNNNFIIPNTRDARKDLLNSFSSNIEELSNAINTINTNNNGLEINTQEIHNNEEDKGLMNRPSIFYPSKSSSSPNSRIMRKHSGSSANVGRSSSHRFPNFRPIIGVEQRRSNSHSSDSSSASNNRKQLEKIFNSEQKFKSLPPIMNCCCNNAKKNKCDNGFCPGFKLNSISVILLIAILIHTIVIVVLTTVVLYVGGTTALEESDFAKNTNLVQDIIHFFDTASTVTVSMQNFFESQYPYLHRTGQSLVDPYETFTTYAGPLLYSRKSFTSMVYYGNSNGDSVGVEISKDNGNILFLTERPYKKYVLNNESTTVDPVIYYFHMDQSYRISDKRYFVSYAWSVLKRPWYLAAVNSSSHVMWSQTFVAVMGKLSISCVIQLNNTLTGKNMIEIVGTHVYFASLDSYLISLAESPLLNRKGHYSVMLIERDGHFLSSSFGIKTSLSNGNRSNIIDFTNSSLTDSDSKLQYGIDQETTTLLRNLGSLLLKEGKVTYPTGSEATGRHLENDFDCSNYSKNFTDYQYCYLNRKVNITKFPNVGNVFVILTSIRDEYGMDFYLVIASPYQTLSDVIVENFVGLLCVIILTAVFGTLAFVTITTFISTSIWNVARKLYHISRLKNEEFSEKSDNPIVEKITKIYHNMFYEISVLWKVLGNVERVNNSFVKYVPKSIIQHIVEGSTTSARLGMTNTDMTIMFTDLVNFTNLSESITIQNLLLVISKYFEIVTNHVQDQGGYIDKYIGDGVMALFNNPFQPLTKHADNACRAALKIITDLKELNRQLKLVDGLYLPLDVKARIGINTAHVLCGNIGTNDRLNFTAVGDGVNIASRLEGLNKFYGTQILIGEDTFLAIKGTHIRETIQERISPILEHDSYDMEDILEQIDSIIDYEKHYKYYGYSQLDLPPHVCFFIDSICLKGKDKHIGVYALQCLRNRASYEQLFIERIYEVVRKELLEEKRLIDVVKLLQLSIDFLNEKFVFSNERPFILEGDTYDIVLEAAIKLKERIEQLLERHERIKRIMSITTSSTQSVVGTSVGDNNTKQGLDQQTMNSIRKVSEDVSDISQCIDLSVSLQNSNVLLNTNNNNNTTNNNNLTESRISSRKSSIRDIHLILHEK
ncbi:hypothetical protein ABK040_011847 [Willaertia magna]